MVIVVDGATTAVEQVTKQLYKVINVVKVSDITEEGIVARELALIKVKATPATRSEIIQIVDIFRANIVDVAPSSLVLEVTGDEAKIDSLYQLLKGFGVREVSRTGRIALVRGVGGLPGVRLAPVATEADRPGDRAARATLLRAAYQDALQQGLDLAGAMGLKGVLKPIEVLLEGGSRPGLKMVMAAEAAPFDPAELAAPVDRLSLQVRFCAR